MNSLVVLAFAGLLGFISCGLGILITYRNAQTARFDLLKKMGELEKDLTTDIDQIGLQELATTQAGRQLLSMFEEPQARWTVKETVKFSNPIIDSLSSVSDSIPDSFTRILAIPLIGNIVAGEPIKVGNESFDVYDEDDVVEVSANMLPTNRTDDLFALRVSGDSMIDAMVNDGDILIMRQQETAQNGDMVAVWLESDGTTTLKHFFHEGKQIRLQPANPTMEPIYVLVDNVRIQGKVMMVLRETL
jgi:repressor LexA